ncbi:MAG: hypothetical protein GWP07_01155 [Xanthomonadaceae bacterium]|nr:hypothetical protein [Xanthomonadaceae bacterium]
MQSEVNQDDVAIRQVRGFFYDLAKSFFLEDPDQEKIERWREIINPLGAEAPSMALAEAARQLSLALAELDLPAIKNEYYDFFVNPFSHQLISWTVSSSVNGRNFGPQLVEIRQLMAKQGLVKEEEFKEPEDSLPVLLDLMTRLIEMEDGLGDGGVTAQQHILQKFLIPLTTYIHQQLQAGTGAGFYALCAGFLEAWLQLDESYFI